MNRIILAVLISALATNAAMATTVSDCISCTDLSGQCGTYGDNCCVPCKTKPNVPSGNDSFEYSECAENCPSMDWTTLPDYGGALPDISVDLWQARCNVNLLKGTGRCAFRCIGGKYGTITTAQTSDGQTSYMQTYGCQSCPNTGIACQLRSMSFGGSICAPLMAGRDVSTSDLGSNTDITECYIPSGSYGDSTGNFTLSGNCYYKS